MKYDTIDNKTRFNSHIKILINWLKEVYTKFDIILTEKEIGNSIHFKV